MCALDTMPEMIYRFIEQNVRTGNHISLKCSARGSPPPQVILSFIHVKKLLYIYFLDFLIHVFLLPFRSQKFTWLLDSQPILDVSAHRYAIGQFVDVSGDVISHLNISHVRADDGGLYRCIAMNSVGSVSHADRLNIFGPPYVRAISPIKAVAGEDLVVHCPYSGYPMDSIRWEKAGIEITSSRKKYRAQKTREILKYS
jgi:Down syndrome cell adhesion molecule